MPKKKKPFNKVADKKPTDAAKAEPASTGFGPEIDRALQQKKIRDAYGGGNRPDNGQ
jgi:hypothetical protein